MVLEVRRINIYLFFIIEERIMFIRVDIIVFEEYSIGKKEFFFFKIIWEWGFCYYLVELDF